LDKQPFQDIDGPVVRRMKVLDRLTRDGRCCLRAFLERRRAPKLLPLADVPAREHRMKPCDPGERDQSAGPSHRCPQRAALTSLMRIGGRRGSAIVTASPTPQ